MRFKLPATFCGMLRYEDPDGDMLSLNTDDEMKKALRLCGDGKTLKMTLTAAQRSVQQEEHSVDACALSNVLEENSAAVQAVGDVRSHSASSESGSRLQMELERQEDFEIVRPNWRFDRQFNRESEWYGPPYNRWVRTGPPSPSLTSKLWNAIQAGSFHTLSLVEEVIADEFLWS